MLIPRLLAPLLVLLPAVAHATATSPLPEPCDDGTCFHIRQTATGQVLRNGPADVVRAYARYANASAPTAVAYAAVAVQTASVSAVPEQYDTEYLCPVTVGNETLNLNFDTGSSDFWVFSTLQPSAQTLGHSLYNNATGKLVQNQSWSIGYGDGSGAAGIVYADKVVVGAVTATSQAVEAATSVSAAFTRNTQSDGLVGLSFPNVNMCSPTCTTFLTNILGSLAAKVFTASLKHNAAGSYDFGFIDQNKYSGTVTYAAVTTVNGFWEFNTSGYAVGSGLAIPLVLNVIADTGTSLVYIQDSVLLAYYAQVSGARSSTSAGGWIFPCSATLPSFSVFINGYRATIPGTYLNYAPYTSTMCFGGLQSGGDIGYNILGDVFLKSQFVVFDPVVPQIGFASQCSNCAATASTASSYMTASSAKTSTAGTGSMSASTSSFVPKSTQSIVPSAFSNTLVTISSTNAPSTSTKPLSSSTGSTPPSSTISATSTSSPASSATLPALACPSSDTTTFRTPNNLNYTIQCFMDHRGGDLALVGTSSLAGCINACAVTTSCLAISWVPSNNFCYLKSSLQPVRANSLVWGAVLSSAISSATPATTTNITCPAANGTNVTSSSGGVFAVQCGADRYGGDLTYAPADSLSECLDECTATKGCVAVSLVPGSPGACFLKSSVQPVKAASGVWSAVLVG